MSRNPSLVADFMIKDISGNDWRYCDLTVAFTWVAHADTCSQLSRHESLTKNFQTTPLILSSPLYWFSLWRHACSFRLSIVVTTSSVCDMFAKSFSTSCGWWNRWIRVTTRMALWFPVRVGNRSHICGENRLRSTST